MALKNNTLENFVERPARSQADLQEWFAIGISLDSLPQEVSADWEKWVAEPVVTHRLAPRMARALLEITGFYLDRGFDAQALLGTFLLISSKVAKDSQE